MKRRNETTESDNNAKYRVIKLEYSHSGTPKTHIKYEKNGDGVLRQTELNGLLDQETVLHVLKKRGF